MVRFWNSKLRLALISCILAILHVSLRNVRKLLNRLEHEVEFNGGFNNDMDYVLDTLEYMNDLKIGKAFIRPVVEQAKKVREFWWRCRLGMPTTVSDQEWTKNDDLYIYSATYDSRYNSLYPVYHTVQILAMSFRSLPANRKFFCNLYDLRFQQYSVVEATVREIWQNAWDPRDYFYIPNLISCPVVMHFQQVDNLVVSLSSNVCQNQNIAIPVRKELTNYAAKKGVAVCVKGMDFVEDSPERLVEWIEVQFLTGADTIVVYVYHVPPKMNKVLSYYANLGNITVIPLTLPGKSPNESYIRSRFVWRNRQQKRRHELIPYNDCFYRHINSHDYILILDTDELVVPLKHGNWSLMLNYVIENAKPPIKSQITSISILNTFKFPFDDSNSTMPSYTYMLKNRRRSKMISEPGSYGKSFISTKSVVTVFNHFALHRLHENVSRTIYVKSDIALKLHYREKCPIESGKDCAMLNNVTVNDESLDQYANLIIKRVTEVLKLLQLL